MGYAKIEAKKKEYAEKNEAKKQFLKAAQEINTALANIQKMQKKIEEAQSNYYKTLEKTAQTASTLNTYGVKEFEACKKALLEQCRDPKPEPVDTHPVEIALNRLQVETTMMVIAWMEKLEKSVPKDVKPGMVFKDYGGKQLYEITAGPKQSTNANLPGDKGVFFDAVIRTYEGAAKGKTTMLSLADLKKCKYVDA